MNRAGRGMELKRGLVVQKNGQTVIVLTPDGRFRKVKRVWPDVELGSEIVFEDLPLFCRLPYGRLAPMMLLVALVVFMTGLMNAWPHHVELYVCVGPEPKVEFGLNRLNRVVEVLPGETAGVALDSAKAFYGRPIDQVLQELMEASRAISDDGILYYVVTVPAVDVQDMAVETASLEQRTAVHPWQQRLSSALILSVPASVRDEATKRGVYPGDYAVYWLYTQSGGAYEQLAQFLQ